MSQEFLLTILADGPPETHAAIERAVRGPGPDRHEVWRKRYQARPNECNLGSIRVVGLADPIHDKYRTWTPPRGEVKRLRLAVADQTRRRVLAAGATRVTVTIVSLDDASADTLNTDGEIDR